MKSKLKVFLKHNYIYIIMVVLVIARIALGYMLGAWYMVDYVYDDLAMVDGISFLRITEPSDMSLIKNLSFSAFLGITGLTGIPYTIMTGILWALTALVVWLFLRKVTDKKWVQLFGFIYVLFLPIAFESWGGLRVYRNAIIAPCIILTFFLFFLFIIDIIKWNEVKKSTVITSILAGIAFCYTYFLKEDGIWLVLSIAALLGACVCIIIVRTLLARKKKKDRCSKKSIKWALVCIIPFIVLFIGDNTYKSFNQMAFGVREVNTRTEGELGKFVYNVYKIKSPNRSMLVWAPYDAIEAAFKASPTLSSHPQLLEKIMTTEWFNGDIKENPIGKDFLTWVIRTELVHSGLWTSEKDVNDMFRQVNQELKQAFDDGTLEKETGKIQIVSSIGGYSLEEVKNSNLASQLWWALEDAVWLKGYNIGYQYDVESNKDKVERVTNLDKNSLNNPGGTKKEISKGIIEVFCVFYRIINTVLLVGSVVFIVSQIVKLIKHKKQDIALPYLAGLGLFMFGITFAYTFATAWFFLYPSGVEFYGSGREVFIFYNVGVPGLLTTAFIVLLPGISTLLSKNKCL